MHVEGPQLPGGMGAGCARLSPMGSSWHGRRKPCGSQNCFGPLVGDIHLGGEVDCLYFLSLYMTGHPCSYFPLGPNPQGALLF